MEEGRRGERQARPRQTGARQAPARQVAPRQSAQTPGQQKAEWIDQPLPSGRGKEGANRRRKNSKKGKTFLSNPLLYLLFIFGISAILAALGWTAANDVLALNKVEKPPVTITITENSSFGDVVDQLKDTGMIEYKGLFHLFASLTGAKDKIAPGTYWINTDMDYRAIISGMSANSSTRAKVEKLAIPEGYNIDQIFALLEEKGVSTIAKLQETAANHNYAFSFLQDLPMGDYKRLEGYLFPDTYDFYMGEDPKYVINKLLANFDAKLTDKLRTQIANSGYSIQDILKIASMIEKESDGTDRNLISSVIHNRIERPTRETAGYLNIDATLQYVLPKGETVTQWHYSNLDSPFNTYLHQGLPPTPIANPGMACILAAMNPDQTGYYFYARGKDGLHHFSKTQAEHNAFLASGA